MWGQELPEDMVAMDIVEDMEVPLPMMSVLWEEHDESDDCPVCEMLKSMPVLRENLTLFIEIQICSSNTKDGRVVKDTTEWFRCALRAEPNVTAQTLALITKKNMAEHIGGCVKTPRVMPVRMSRLMNGVLEKQLQHMCGGNGGISDKSIAKFEKIAKEARHWHPITAKQYEWAQGEYGKLESMIQITSVPKVM